MYKYKHNEQERQFLKEQIAKLKHENSLGSTLSSQAAANEHVIKQLEMLMDQKECIEDGYVRLDMIGESIKDKNFRCTPNSVLAQ